MVDDGEVLNRYEYDAWGNLTVCEETVENRFKFNGQQYDSITQQYYLRARYYNPVLARFTQEDTYYGDGLNLYVYCRNNPLCYVDPSGHFSNCEKEAYKKYREEGKTPREALDAILRDRFTKENERKGLSPQDAAERAKVDLEIHKAMQKYQMFVNMANNDPNTIAPTAREHGTEVHNLVAKQMERWVESQGFTTIKVDTEIYFRNTKEEGGSGSSRIDLLIRENTKGSYMANGNNYWIGDIKTGTSQRGSTYGKTQMEKNQRNVTGIPGRTNLSNVTHWQFNPGGRRPQQNKF